MLNPENIMSCPIWPSHQAIGEKDARTGQIYIDSSLRVPEPYVIPEKLASRLEDKRIDDKLRARLTTLILDQQRLGVQRPEVDEALLEAARLRRELSAHERAQRLLRFLADSTSVVGQILDLGDQESERLTHGWPVQFQPGMWATMAWSESLTWDEVMFLVGYLVEQGWILLGAESDDAAEIKVTVEGFRQVAEVATAPDPSQGFVAMWFDDRMDKYFETGLKVGIEAAGYRAMLMKRKPDVEKIDDDTIAEIRRSRFLVADFTQGKGGARGSVYFEAGFAQGLGLPVIYTCRRNMVGKLHFDTRQYAHILWDTPEELALALEARIRARIGEGPGRQAST